MGGWGVRIGALGLLLSLLGGGPLLVLAWLFPDAPALVPILLSLTVLPLGLLALGLAAIVLLTGWLRRR